jgi:hypothetical protein
VDEKMEGSFLCREYSFSFARLMGCCYVLDAFMALYTSILDDNSDIWLFKLLLSIPVSDALLQAWRNVSNGSSLKTIQFIDLQRVLFPSISLLSIEHVS